MINGERLWASLMDLARIGGTPKGGVRRITLTETDREGRDLFVRWARDAALTVRWDAVGNIFARRPGSDPLAAPVVMGSHLDSQPSGGKFDGAYGVMAGLEVVRTLNDRRIAHSRAHRGRLLDKRGGFALRAGHDGIGRVRRRVPRRASACGEG